jgi:hypothetical protein
LIRLSRTSIADEMREEYRRRVLGESALQVAVRAVGRCGYSTHDLHKKSLRMQVWGFQNILGSSNI